MLKNFLARWFLLERYL